MEHRIKTSFYVVNLIASFSIPAFGYASQMAPKPSDGGVVNRVQANLENQVLPDEDQQKPTEPKESREGFLRRLIGFLKDESNDTSEDSCPINPEAQIKARCKVKNKVSEYTLVEGNSSREFGAVAHILKSQHEEYFFVQKDNGTVFQWNHKGSLKAVFPDQKFKKILNFSGVLMMLGEDESLYMYEPGSSHGLREFESEVRDISLHNYNLVILLESGMIEMVWGSRESRFSVKEEPMLGTALAESTFSLQNSYYGLSIPIKVEMLQKVKTLDSSLFWQNRRLVFATELYLADETVVDMEDVLPVKIRYELPETLKYELVFEHGDNLKAKYLDVSPGKFMDSNPSILINFRFHRTLKHPLGVTPQYEVFYEEMDKELIESLKNDPYKLSKESVHGLLEACMDKGKGEWKIHGIALD